ncbi:MAG TPA: hypothetical protein VL749_09425 [Patescibacteria group bacterium]|nr:hypothetical protein [Patescibacteria group bacterium]
MNLLPILPAAAPVAGSLLPDDADAGARARPSAPSGDVQGELDDEVARLLRVRSGELAEPVLWRRPSHRREVDAVVHQLGPIRTRASLLSSWERESRHSAPVRLAYAVAWLALARTGTGAATRHARRRPRLAVLTGRG